MKMNLAGDETDYLVLQIQKVWTNRKVCPATFNGQDAQASLTPKLLPCLSYSPYCLGLFYNSPDTLSLNPQSTCDPSY